MVYILFAIKGVFPKDLEPVMCAYFVFKFNLYIYKVYETHFNSYMYFVYMKMVFGGGLMVLKSK